MNILIKLLAAIGLIAIILTALGFWKFNSLLKESHQAIQDDYKIKETADWFGKTGLDEETERELPHYLRREFGERLSTDPNALKANHLRYLGVFDEGGHTVHYWAIPSKNDQEAPYFAYVDIDLQNNQSSMGWGDKAPPNHTQQTK